MSSNRDVSEYLINIVDIFIAILLRLRASFHHPPHQYASIRLSSTISINMVQQSNVASEGGQATSGSIARFLFV